jgi:hypothetical protein
MRPYLQACDWELATASGASYRVSPGSLPYFAPIGSARLS